MDNFFYNMNQKLKDVLDAPKSEHKQLNERANSKAVAEDFGATAAIAGGAALGSALGAVKGRYDDMKYKERGRAFGEPESDWDKPRTTMQRVRAAAGFPSKNDPNVKTNEEAMDEGSTGDYSAKKARAGKDIGKPGKQFAKIAKSAGEKYGSKERGEKVAGAVLNKLRDPKEDVEEGLGSIVKKIGGGMKRAAGKALDTLGHGSDEELIKDLQRKSGVPATGKKPPRTPIAKEEYGPLEETEPMTPKQKKFAKLAPPADKITFADKIAGAKKEVDEMLGDVAAEAMRGAVRGKRQVADEGWDDMVKDVERRRTKPAVGSVERGHKHDIEHTATGRRVTRRTDDQGYSVGADDDTEGKPEKKGRGRPKGSTGKIGAKGPSGKSKLMTKESDNESDDIKQAMAMLKKAGYKVTKAAEQELDEKAVSQSQAIAARIARGVQKGEVKAKKGTASAEMAKMEPKELKKFAKTDTKGLPKKVKAKEEVEETTVSGSVAPSTAAPAKGKGGMSFGKGIYDSMNRELEQMIAETMNVSMNMSSDPHGGPSKSLTVTATDEDAEYLGKLLKMAGVGGEAGGCGCGQQPCACNSADQVDENAPEWPTDEVTSDDALQYAGGLNKPKTTVAGDGQTTVPVTAVQVREGEEQYKRDLRKLLESAGIEVTDEMLEEGWKEKLAAAGTAAAIGAAGLGMMGGGQAPQSPSHGLNPDTVSSMNAKFQQNRAEEAQLDQRAQAFSKINKDFSDQYVKLIDQRQADASASDAMTAKIHFYTKLEKLLKQYQAMEEGMFEQEQVMAPESKEEELDEELQRIREMAGIGEAAKPDYIDLDRDGNRKESMKKAADDAKKDKKVEESILAMTNLWKAYKG